MKEMFALPAEHCEGGGLAPARESPCERLRRLATAQARRLGLSPEEAEDCGSEYLLRAMHRGLVGAEDGAADAPAPAQWRRMTWNFALNVRRAATRRTAHQAELPEASGVEGNLGAREIADTASGPESEALRHEFWVRLRPALYGLRPGPRALLLRHHLDGESCAKLAAAYGLTPHAVEEALHRARRRLRELLERVGITEAELRAYLAAFTPTAAPLMPEGLAGDDGGAGAP